MFTMGELLVDFFVWRQEWNVGLATIDDQHKTIIADLGSIYEAITRHESRTAATQKINKLIADSGTHFLDENVFMINQNYPAINEHVKHHELFMGTLKDFKYSYDPSQIDAMHKALLKIKEWFVKHILEYDKLYMEHIYV